MIKRKMLSVFLLAVVLSLSACHQLDEVVSNITFGRNPKSEFIGKLKSFTEPNKDGLIGIVAEREGANNAFSSTKTVTIDIQNELYHTVQEDFVEAKDYYNEKVTDDRYTYSRHDSREDYFREKRSEELKDVIENYTYNRNRALAYLERLPKESFRVEDGRIFLDVIYFSDGIALYALTDGLVEDFSGKDWRASIYESGESLVYIDGESLVFEWTDGGRGVVRVFSPQSPLQTPRDFYTETP